MHEKSRKRNAYRRGIAAEYIAGACLFFKGYRIIGHRYRNHAGEIDLIALKGKTVVFVEVKTRKNQGEALEAIIPASRKRIERAASGFVSGNKKYRDFHCRFDVVAVCPPLSIKHIKNAWFAEP